MFSAVTVEHIVKHILESTILFQHCTHTYKQFQTKGVQNKHRCTKTCEHIYGHIFFFNRSDQMLCCIFYYTLKSTTIFLLLNQFCQKQESHYKTGENRYTKDSVILSQITSKLCTLWQPGCGRKKYKTKQKQNKLPSYFAKYFEKCNPTILFSNL